MEKMLATFLKAMGITPQYIEQSVQQYKDVADDFRNQMVSINHKLDIVEQQQQEILAILRENKKPLLKLIDNENKTAGAS